MKENEILGGWFHTFPPKMDSFHGHHHFNNFCFKKRVATGEETVWKRIHFIIGVKLYIGSNARKTRCNKGHLGFKGIAGGKGCPG